MIKRVLVPLDGSELAERALVVAGDLAESLSATVILARVVPPPATGRFYQANLSKELTEAQTREAEAYLASAAERVREDRLVVETRLLHGEVAPALVRAARHERCELIAISSHGMSGLGSQVFGSVAQKLLSDEGGGDRRVEDPPRPFLQGAERFSAPSRLRKHCGRAGHVADARRQGNVLSGNAVGHALAIPALENVAHAIGDTTPKTKACDHATANLTVGAAPLCHDLHGIGGIHSILAETGQ